MIKHAHDKPSTVPFALLNDHSRHLLETLQDSSLHHDNVRKELFLQYQGDVHGFKQYATWACFSKC
jgi:hypothetical protein